MSHISTSSSETKPVLAKFKPKETEELPEVTRPWLRWLLIPVVLLAAEGAARLAVSLDLIERPVVYGHHHIDVKVDVFRNEYLPANESGKRYLVMGSSMPNTNIDPNRLTETMEEETGEDWTGFNGAFFAGRYDDMIYFLDWYYDQWEFEHLVMTFDPWGLRPYRLDNMQEQLKMPPHEEWLAHNSMLFGLRNQIRLYEEERDNRRRGLELLDLSSTMYGWVRTIKYFGPNEDTLESHVKSQADSLLDPRLDPPEVYQLTYDKIDVVQEWAAERGITIWWVIQPLNPVVEKHLHEEFQHPQWILKAEKHLMEPGNYLLNLKDLEGTRLGVDEFFDANHLTPYGAAVYTEELAERWADAYLDLKEEGRIP